MLKKIALVVLFINSSLFTPPVQAQPMNCQWGYVVRTTDGYPACVIDAQPGGCEYCEVTPGCP